MKKRIVFLITSSLLIVFQISAQKVDDIPLQDLKEEYISISVSGGKGKSVYIKIDFGQTRIAGEEVLRILDREDNPMLFNSLIHAVNFMRQFGYELYLSGTSGSEGNINPFYILRKEQDE